MGQQLEFTFLASDDVHDTGWGVPVDVHDAVPLVLASHVPPVNIVVPEPHSHNSPVQLNQFGQRFHYVDRVCMEWNNSPHN